MGFWWSIGDDDVAPAPSSNPQGSTIPITRIDYSDLFRKSGNIDPIRSGALSAAAAAAATTLCLSQEVTPLWRALEYSLRETIRNTFEHGQTDSVWFTASTRPQKDDVQIAILDEGRGIRESLEETGRYSFSGDADAIRKAMEPGVSRNSGKKRTPAQEERLREQHPGQDPAIWDNSGYGLTDTTDICKFAGQYSVISGDQSVSFVGADVTGVACHRGTAFRFVLYPSKVADALAQVALDDPDSGSGMTMSQKLRKLKDKFH
ncbi:MAG: hypothetical protein KDE27_16650 [Planctomycetes bacterium]|nr:hypothetical protein [Planctomycetota bacterium]